MRIQELIQKLSHIKEEYGNVEVISGQCDKHGYWEWGDPNPEYQRPYGFDKEVVTL
jgi:hypothetical protein